jgi:putative membrane protein
MMCGYWFGGLTWLVMPVVMLLVLALAVALVWTLVRWLTRKATLPAPHDAYPMANEPSALEVLQLRYARGEIDTQTFENMRERLVASGAREDYR